MKLIVGNRNYSSWSLRGWLACKQSGLPFEVLTVPLYGEDWEAQRRSDDLAPSSGKVPIRHLRAPYWAGRDRSI